MIEKKITLQLESWTIYRVDIKPFSINLYKNNIENVRIYEFHSQNYFVN